jgi:pimeloyl-ACP methyl ester carboxylesterase
MGTRFFTKKGFLVKPVPIQWNYRTMSDYIEEFERFYSVHKGKKNYLFGFSYGAVIAFSTAEKLQPEKIYLCSLSPDFKEDVKGMEEWIKKYIGARRLNDCLQRSGVDIAKQLTVPTVIFYGEEEVVDFPQMKKRILETKRLAKNVEVVEVANAPHDISFPSYQNAIIERF